jgi:hypothetical protein
MATGFRSSTTDLRAGQNTRITDPDALAAG